MSFETTLVVIALFLIVSVLASKIAGRFGVPALLIFLVIGIAGGQFGMRELWTQNYAVTQGIGVIALCFILFSGGLSTEVAAIRGILPSGLVLSTFGVLFTTGLVGWFAWQFCHFSWLEGLLLGATVASTDVAAVFTVLRGRNVSLQGVLKPLLEFESAVNDPTTVFLSVGLLGLISHPEGSLWSLLPTFFLQMLLGALLGLGSGKAIAVCINRIRLEFEGLYPVLSFAFVLFTYGATQRLGGSGFLAVYVAGIFLGENKILHKKSLSQFHDGAAWLMQIAMFLTMGLLVEAHELLAVAGAGILVSIFLILVARPVSVHLCLAPFAFSRKEKLFISWAGLRGAVPIILATFPLVAGIPHARMIFNLVFVVVFISVFIEGSVISFVAKILGVDAPLKSKFRYPIEFNPTEDLKNELVEIAVPAQANANGKSLLDLHLPQGALVVLIQRQGDVIVPRGSTVIEPGDRLLTLAGAESIDSIRKALE